MEIKKNEQTKWNKNSFTDIYKKYVVTKEVECEGSKEMDKGNKEVQNCNYKIKKS